MNSSRAALGLDTEFRAKVALFQPRLAAFVALRGGMGTVTELSLVWNKLQTRVIESRPVVLVGDSWPPVIEAFRKHLVVSDSDVRLLDFAQTAEEAVQIILEKSKGVRL